jgi:hypothetical protein
MNKTFNLIIMVLMFALAARQGYVISQVGANATNVFSPALSGLRDSSPAHSQQTQQLRFLSPPHLGLVTLLSHLFDSHWLRRSSH